jgi:hypothetical protein
VSYAKANRRWCSVTDQKFKYNYFYGGGRQELFNLIEDPHETTNLLATKKMSEFEDIVSVMKTKLIELEIEHWDPDYIVDGDFKVFDDYVPNPSRNIARPQYPKNLVHEDEINGQNNFVDEVIEAVKDESVVRISDLDYKSWQANLNISDDDMKRTLKSTE